LNLNGTFQSYHFGEGDDILAGLFQTGALQEIYIDAGRSGGTVTMPSEQFIAYLAGGCDLNKLRETIDILKSHGIKIGGYLREQKVPSTRLTEVCCAVRVPRWIELLDCDSNDRGVTTCHG
jgi:hypothetical protein